MSFSTFCFPLLKEADMTVAYRGFIRYFLSVYNRWFQCEYADILARRSICLHETSFLNKHTQGDCSKLSFMPCFCLLSINIIILHLKYTLFWCIVKGNVIKIRRFSKKMAYYMLWLGDSGKQVIYKTLSKGKQKVVIQTALYDILYDNHNM